MVVAELTLEAVVARLSSPEPFCFSRWGDGEWQSVTGRASGHNCDGHPYWKDLGRRLAAVLRSRPPYLLGMQPLALRVYGDRVRGWLRANRLQDLAWHDADVLHKANEQGRLGPLLEALRARPFVMVGPAHLDGLRLFPVAARVAVPAEDAWSARARIVAQTLAALKHLPADAVVGLSCGMTAEVVLHELHLEEPAGATVVDFGSLWDVHVGVASRSYMKRMLAR